MTLISSYSTFLLKLITFLVNKIKGKDITEGGDLGNYKEEDIDDFFGEDIDAYDFKGYFDEFIEDSFCSSTNKFLPENVIF